MSDETKDELKSELKGEIKEEITTSLKKICTKCKREKELSEFKT